MKEPKIIFLRHAETEKDSQTHPSLWILSEAGQKQAEDFSRLDICKEIDSIYISNEKKALLTAEPVCRKTGKNPIAMSFFNEVQRGDKFFSKEEFEEEKKKQLLDLDYQAFGGESGHEALLRFTEGIEKIMANSPDKTVLIVTHGTILNIYFADLLGQSDILYERWQQTPFCAFGVLEGGKIIQDII